MKTALIRSWHRLLFASVAIPLLLLAGCDSSAIDGSLPTASVLDDGINAQTRVDLCHVNGQGEYIKITVAEAAYETHLSHGDASPGQSVPGMGGHVFDDDCQPSLAETCPCFDATSIIEANLPAYMPWELLLYSTSESGVRVVQLWDGHFDYWAIARQGDDYNRCTARYPGHQASSNTLTDGQVEACMADLYEAGRVFNITPVEGSL